MIIIDKSYISAEFKKYLENTQIPVLLNSIAEVANEDDRFNLHTGEGFSTLYSDNTRLYTLSENSLEWIKNNIANKSLHNCIEIMKDKYAFREKIQSLYPNFYFKKVFLHELDSLEIDEKAYPLILKPVVGFFSAGVYALANAQDLQNAVQDLKENYSKWKSIFPASVVGESEFILEQYITGDEYAIDAYFDENGKAVVLNILAHDFVSQEDVSDTLYYTSKEIVEKYASKMETYFNEINTLLCIKNFPFHVEVRIDKDEVITPIEFNPLRFAGFCTTDITQFAFGFHTYDYYFRNKRPDWQNLLQGKDGKKYTFILLNKPLSYTTDQKFDFDMLKKDFHKVLCLRELDYTKPGNPFGIIFTETPHEHNDELIRIMHSDLTEYIVK